ncbi:molybdenum metabolism regulator [Shewanella sp. NFH-SH190041]|uniref:WGR domain-containing protein n=1 Tax=Shewanella sp. NFH-SH190041 TaxID=2950245 RepID=UPI0021C27867|nr:WGR domain-containing protein [Shewanella sp. NFH-SH190041]BDM63517.1 molybdenum metabolism regulator [Shewanella sp. NFH-SH190041]
MSKEIYLELSEDNGSSHKFYKILISDCDVTIEYGRIGNPGRSSTKTFSTLNEAEIYANKQANAKKRKGYEDAVQGQRAARPIRAVAQRPTQSAATSGRRTKPKQSAPVIAQYHTEITAFGIFVDQQHIYIGDETGRVSVLDHDYHLLREYQLPSGTKCIVADGANVFAGTNQGQVYEITGKIARLAYDCPGNAAIYWMDLCDGVLAVSDNEGGLFVYDYEGEPLFHKSTNNGSAWLVRVDESSIYHGGQHLARYAMDGSQLWQSDIRGILFGYQTETCIYAAARGHVAMVDKVHGSVVRKYPVDWAPSNCTSQDGMQVFAQENRNLVAWKKSGEKLFELASPNSGMSMQYFAEKLFVVGNTGLAVVDVSEASIAAAQDNQLPEVKTFRASRQALPEVDSTALELAAGSEQGIELVCIRDGSHLRVRVVTPGYDHAMNCQFPKNLRVEGRRFLAERVELSRSGTFYRISGNIFAL